MQTNADAPSFERDLDFVRRIIKRAVPGAVLRLSADGADVRIWSGAKRGSAYDYTPEQRAGMALLGVGVSIRRDELANVAERLRSRYGDVATQTRLPFKVKALSHRRSWRGPRLASELLELSHAPHFVAFSRLASEGLQAGEKELEQIGRDLVALRTKASPAKAAHIDQLIEQIGGRLAYRRKTDRHIFQPHRVSVESERNLMQVALEFGATRTDNGRREWRINTPAGEYQFNIRGASAMGLLRNDKKNFHEITADDFRSILRSMGAVPAPSGLSVHREDALAQLASIEGSKWAERQLADRTSLSDPRGFFANMAAFKALQETKAEVGEAAKDLLVWDLIPDAGFIEGQEGRVYTVLPDGSIALNADTATPEKRAEAAKIMIVA